jgi:hypothetical protein
MTSLSSSCFTREVTCIHAHVAEVTQALVLGRTFVMVQLYHSNDLGSLWLCSPLAIRVLPLLFAFQLVMSSIGVLEVHVHMHTRYMYTCTQGTCIHAHKVHVNMHTRYMYTCTLCTCIHAHKVHVYMHTRYMYTCTQGICTHAHKVHLYMHLQGLSQRCQHEADVVLLLSTSDSREQPSSSSFCVAHMGLLKGALQVPSVYSGH